jgi:SAM-dependent methyltransferase
VARPIPSAEQIQTLREKYSLNYQVANVLTADVMVGLEGKRVLEVGGSLPEAFVFNELKVASWLALEEMDYYAVSGATSPGKSNAIPLSRLAKPPANYQLAHGQIEQFPSHLAESFDVVFSTSAFEHIADLATGLKRMHAALVPGGYLVSIFSPIWSSYNGHHLHSITDSQGKVFNYGKADIPPWAHLLMTPSEMRDHLRQLTDEATVQEIVFQIYKSSSINRLFCEDYISLVTASPFTVLKMDRTFESEVPPSVQETLERRYPGYRSFSNNGLRIVLRKD